MQIETSTIIPYGKIYRLTNKINGKMYHGQTTEKDVKDRWDAYKRLDCKSQKKLYNAIKKYGWNNFLTEVVDTTPQDQSQLDNLEIFYIAKFDSFHNGYNCNEGGKGNKGFKHSEETKRKISEALKGKRSPQFRAPLSDETRRKISEANTGRKHSKVSIEKMAKAMSGENNPMFGRCNDKNPMFGNHHSEEVRKRISASLKLLHLAKVKPAN